MHNAAGFIRKHAADITLVTSAFQALFSVAFLSGSFSRIMFVLKELTEFTEKTPDLGQEFVDALSETVAPYLTFIEELIDNETNYHHVEVNSYIGRFVVAHHSTFSKNQHAWNTSVATDSEFLYLYIGT
jgi:hypothetical protein